MLLWLVQGSSVITKLSPYLTVQMVRFFFKVDTRQKAKILRKVCIEKPPCPVLLAAFVVSHAWREELLHLGL